MKSDFSKIKRKMILQILAIVAISFGVGYIALYFFIDGALQDPFARFVTSFLMNTMNISYDESVLMYMNIFQLNKNLWLAFGMLIILIFIFYFSLKKFTKYFDEISGGVDNLVSNERDYIKLSPELDFMERKLNSVKSDLDRKTQEAKEAEQRKNDLVVYLAHDLKTPLTSIIGYLSLIEESSDMPIDQRAKYVNITLDKAYRLEGLINEFFDITRFNLQSIELVKMNFDLEIMLRQMLDEFYPSFEEKGLKAALNIEEIPMFYGDADKLSRVFNNIIKNAISHSYEDSDIVVKVSDRGNSIEVSIFNEGDVISERNLETIFEKFYRVDMARGTTKGGAGLGLAIAKEIVLAHGGTIWAENVSGGIIFKVDLPK